jgi:transposase
MPRTTPPLDFDHKPGFEIATKHKEAIRQLHSYRGKSIDTLIVRYSLSRSSIIHILGYPAPERVRPTRTGRPKLLSDQKVAEIIEYLAESWENRILNWTYLRDELKLDCTPQTLATRLKQQGYYAILHTRNPISRPRKS